ncbi:MAG: Rpn family recombination-promoting nuclease/putative transposase [Lachnospiraceae bacterium]|nr:Rpn family recombination-promoting nuclease/putative transposase [Lachnospiraceae bacterium]
MSKKVQILKPDIILKNYWNDNEQFADLFNAVLFQGKQIIKPEELEDVDTEESTILEHKDYAESIKASRDVIKIQKKSSVFGVQFVLLGLENQERIHYAMPMRVMGYDYGTYKKQYDSNAKKYKTADDMKEDEFLSRMKKTDKLLSVITIVVYYGEKPWDGAKTLHEMLDIPEEMKPYVNDYKMLLVEARKNDLQLHNINNRDLFSLLQIILSNHISKNTIKEKVIEYSRQNKTDRSVVMAVAGATNTKLDYNALGKGDEAMCTLFEEIAKESRAEGEAKGEARGKVEGEAKGIVEAGLDFGLSENDILIRLQRKLDISLQIAQEYFSRFGKQTV